MLGEGCSGRSLVAGPFCQTAGIPIVSPSSTDPEATEIGDDIFRVRVIDPCQGKSLAARNATKAAIIISVKGGKFRCLQTFGP